MTEVKISSAGKEYLARAADNLGEIFKTDPALRFVLSSLSTERQDGYRRDYLYTLFKAASLNGATFQEANDWSCCAIWLPPGKTVDNIFTWIPAGFYKFLWQLGPSGIKRMVFDFQRQSDRCKHDILRHESYFYLFFIGTHIKARGKGLASAVIRRYQTRAAEAGLPIWLEASSAHSRDTYARCGFEVVREFIVGKGTHAVTGEKEANGPGVTIFAMLWRPRSEKTGTSA